MGDEITKIYNQLTVKVSDCFLMVFCKSMLFLFATSRDSSNSVIWICNFFFTRCTSVFNFVSASTTRAFSCSISILVCLLIYFISYKDTVWWIPGSIVFKRFHNGVLLFPGDNTKIFQIVERYHTFLFVGIICLARSDPLVEHSRLTRLEIFDILPVTYLVMKRVLDYRGIFRALPISIQD